jgi:predicted nucleic acid-binding protein
VSFPAFLDTCALYGAAISDLLLELAEEGSYRPLWSTHVLNELEVNLGLRVGSEKAQHRVCAMRTAFPDALVQGYENLIPSMTNHQKDRHVLAAAIRANAEVIVTFNLRDFPVDSLIAYDIQAIHPDDFLLDQLDLFPEVTIRAVESIAEGYEAPPMSTAEYLLKLVSAGVPRFAAAIENAVV